MVLKVCNMYRQAHIMLNKSVKSSIFALKTKLEVSLCTFVFFQDQLLNIKFNRRPTSNRVGLLFADMVEEHKTKGSMR